MTVRLLCPQRAPFGMNVVPMQMIMTKLTTLIEIYSLQNRINPTINVMKHTSVNRQPM
jgi:hypothetical protein